jgi:hypothetical protein
MAFVNVPKDLNRVKTKVALNLTKRQLVCFSVAATVGLPVYFLSKGAIGNSMAVLLMIAVMMPFFFFAMFEKDGQPAEKILRNILRHRLWPGIRPYKTDNIYQYLSEEGKAIATDNKKNENNEKTKKATTAAESKHPSRVKRR